MIAYRSPRKLLFALSFLAALRFAPPIVLAQQSSTLQEKVASTLGKRISEYLSQKPDFGAAAAVVDDTRIIWEKTFGSLNEKGSRPVDPNTMFSIQSMSKSFTALAVLMAVQDGLVDLDTPIKKYLPDFRVHSLYDHHPEELITLRHLLTHRAGLTHEAPFGSNFDDRYDLDKHIQSLSNTWLRYPVGYRLAYSNLGLDLAGYILQKRSGMPFERYVKEKVLDPLGMADSSLDMAVIEKRENRAFGHSSPGDIIPLRIPMIPAGGVYSTVRDMAKYLQFHICKGVVNGRRILRADLMEDMHMIQFARPRQRSGYCLGLLRDPVSHSYDIYHSGGGYGFSSDMVMYPELKLGIIVLFNSSANEFAGPAVRECAASCIAAQYGGTPVDKPGIETMAKLNPNDPRVNVVLGHYGDDREGAMVIERNEGRVRLHIPSSGQNVNFDFYDDQGELVGLVGLFSEIRFLPPYSNKRGSLILIDRRLSNGATFNIYDYNFDPDAPAGPNKAEWSKYLGEYDVLRYGVSCSYKASITVKNGFLFYNDIQCTEHEPGLFFSYDGLPLDFRSETVTFAYIGLRRK